MVYKHSKLSHWNSTSRSLCLIISVPRYFWLKILKNTLSDMLIKPHLLLLVCMVAHWWELITSSAKAVYSNPILNPISRCLFQNCAKIKIKNTWVRNYWLTNLISSPYDTWCKLSAQLLVRVNTTSAKHCQHQWSWAIWSKKQHFQIKPLNA